MTNRWASGVSAPLPQHSALYGTIKMTQCSLGPIYKVTLHNLHHLFQSKGVSTHQAEEMGLENELEGREVRSPGP